MTNECIPDADFLSNSVEVHEPSFETVVMMLQLCELPNVSSTDGKFHHTDITPRVGILPSVRLGRSHHRLRQYRKSFAPIREFHGGKHAIGTGSAAGSSPTLHSHREVGMAHQSSLLKPSACGYHRLLGCVVGLDREMDFPDSVSKIHPVYALPVLRALEGGELQHQEEPCNQTGQSRLRPCVSPAKV